jgi:hypothetical protein
VAVVALVSVAATSVSAQVGVAELRGSVTDASGGALPGVTVVITNQRSGTFREIITGGDGSYFAAQLIPGVFTVTAQLPGFRGFERTDFAIGVGMTLDLDIVLPVGAVEETITVSGASPLVDLTSAEVGGTVTSGELTELPTGNRSYFAAVALLPGIQFNPSSSLGNDNMIANGQTGGGNSVGLDGATNNDDVSGTGAGGQVRVPLESVSEFQVLTNQFDAEFGRVRGAIVNSITKQGTNRFTGAVFNYFTSEAMTSEDFFVSNNDALTKPETSKKEFGGVIGGPIIQDKAHFFFSVERQLVDPSRSRDYPTRPDLNFTLSENWKALNTLIRVDQQINGSNSWAFRWLRESAPQFSLIGGRSATINTLEDETDNDQIYVGTYTSVIGSNKVNTFGATGTSESFWRGNPCWRDAGEVRGGQAGCPPQWTYRSGITDNNLSSANGRDDENLQIRNTFSWFVPDMGGDHDFKFGGTFHRTRVTTGNENVLNGTFEFNTDLVFDSLNPATYPDRLNIQVGNPLGNTFEIVQHTYEAFFQDKWQVNDRFTVGLGVRYDLELFDSGITDNPLFPDGGDPRDKNNVSPRTSVAYDVTGDGRSVIRAGYGIFYDKTTIDGTDNPLQFPKFADSFTAQFPQTSSDPGPGLGVFPTDPFLLNFGTAENCPANPGGPCPFVDHAGINALFPPGTLLRNQGDVYFNSPNQKQPYMHQMTLGYERELMPTVSVSADYIRTMGRDMLARIEYNMKERLGTGRTDPIIFNDVFNALGPDFADFQNDVIVQESVGQTNYDALNIAVEKRYADRWGGRLAYALGKSRGNTFEQWQTISTQVGADLNLDEFQQPAATDRRHILTLSGRTELPGGVTASGVLRYMSGAPFTISNDNFDANQNGILDDPIAAGTYSGTGANTITVENDGGFGGARGPDFLQLDMRFGYRLRPASSNTLDVFFDVFNLTDRANFNNPTGDQRSGNFLRLVALRGGSGFPRSGQFGIRYGF